jgi:hypothetical protein
VDYRLQCFTGCYSVSASGRGIFVETNERNPISVGASAE